MQVTAPNSILSGQIYCMRTDIQISKPHFCQTLQNISSTQGLLLSRQMRRPACCWSAASHRFLSTETRICFQSSPCGILVNRLVLGQNFLQYSGAFAKLRKATICFVMSVRPSVRPSAWNNSAPTGRNSMKFDIWVFFRKSFEIFYVSLRSDKNNEYLIWRPIYIFYHISLSSSCNEKCFREGCRENKDTFYIQ